jgi:hypothetical protein
MNKDSDIGSQGVGLHFGRGAWASSLQRLLNDEAIAQACRQQAARTEPLNAAPASIADLVQTLG